jgi:hypothetical protein
MLKDIGATVNEPAENRRGETQPVDDLDLYNHYMLGKTLCRSERRRKFGDVPTRRILRLNTLE